MKQWEMAKRSQNDSRVRFFIEDAPFTYEYADYYKVLPSIHSWNLDPDKIKNGRKVAEDFEYVSNRNPDIMKIEQLQNWLNSNKNIIGKI